LHTSGIEAVLPLEIVPILMQQSAWKDRTIRLIFTRKYPL
jgi:hypothetical protein